MKTSLYNYLQSQRAIFISEHIMPKHLCQICIQIMQQIIEACMYINACLSRFKIVIMKKTISLYLFISITIFAFADVRLPIIFGVEESHNMIFTKHK